MLFCKPDLNARQMLWGLCSEVSQLESTLLECAIYDSLLRSPEYSCAAQHLHEAGQAIARLRAHASPDLFCDLEKRFPDINSIITQYH